jgi:hypothetical protein
MSMEGDDENDEDVVLNDEVRVLTFDLLQGLLELSTRLAVS